MGSERHHIDGEPGQAAVLGSAAGWLDRIICGDARDMAVVPDGAVSLIITSPPY